MMSLAAAVVAAFPASVALSNAPEKRVRVKATAFQAEPMIHQLVLKLRSPTVAEKASTLGSARISALSNVAGVRLHSVRPMSGDASVVALERPMSLTEARAMAQALNADPAVEYAEPDLPVKRLQVPFDTGYIGRQWNLQVPGTTFNSTINLQSGGTKPFANTGGADFVGAWPRTTGVSTVRVAIIDSGVALTHPDLQAVLLPGYDFVSSNVSPAPANFVANDGDGRDADATDPGDWIDQAAVTASNGLCLASDISDSSWHGTHMTGVVAAAWGGAFAGTSIAGAAPNVRILPVRALGRCGGLSSDVADAIRWAAGVPVPGVPNNPNPARVLNLSLGGGASCTNTFQTAVNEAIAAGAVIFAATGNESGPVSAPANCSGVVAVTAHVINGDNADYANTGTQTTISAPGGGEGFIQRVPNLLGSDSANWIWSTSLFGATTPTSTVSATDVRSGPAIVGFTGTSPATPHVAAVGALMLSLRPAATAAEIRAYLRASVRPHPAGGYCSLAINTCGAGLLDANRALQMFQAVAPTPDAGQDQRVAAGATVNLSGTAAGWGGKTIAGYAWSVESGPALTLTGAGNQNASFVAPAAGSFNVLRLTVTDSMGVTGHDFVTVRTNRAPVLAAVNQNGTVGVALNFRVIASDPDLVDALTYAVSSGNLPAGATLTASGVNAGVFSWPNPTIGTSTFAVTASDGLAQSAPAVVTIMVVAGTAPSISAQPQNQTVNEGASATFSVTAAGAPAPTYQWQRNGVNIGGATSVSYSLTATNADNGVQFRVVVANASGSVTSDPATLTVVSAPPPSGGDSGGSIPLWQLVLLAALGFAGHTRRWR